MLHLFINIMCVNFVDKEQLERIKNCHELKKLQFFGAGPKTAMPDTDISSM